MTSGESPLVATEVMVRRPKHGYFKLLPLVIIYSFGRLGMDFVMGQYVYVEIGKRHNFSQAGIGNNDNVTDCFYNVTDPVFIKQQEVQAEVSTFNLLQTTASTVPAILVTLFMGRFTDRRGRRWGFLLPLAGTCAQCIVNILVLVLKADINFIYAGSIAQGITGGSSVVTMTSMSYAADLSTTLIERFKFILWIEFAFGVSSSLAPLFLGFFVQSSGFLWPLVTLSSALVVCLIYATLFIRETILSTPSYRAPSVLQMLKEGVVVIFRSTVDRRRLKIFLLFGVFFFTVVVETQYSGVQSLFLMDAPLCFTSAVIGLVGGGLTLAFVFGCTIGIMVFLVHLKLDAMTVAIIGITSAVARFTMFGFATTSVMVYIAIPLGVFEFLSLPLVRLRLSKTVDETEQGSLFAVVECLSGAASILGNVAWNTIYTNSLNLEGGLVFFIMAATEGLAIILICVYKLINREEASPGDGPLKTVSGEQYERME